MKTKFKIIAAFLFLIIGAPLTTRAADLKFSPSSGTYTVGQTFPVNVVVDSQDQPMNAISAVINFTQSTMEVVSIVKDPPIMDLWVENPVFSNSAGTVSGQGIVFNPGYTGPSGRFITINFRPKIVGSGSLNFSSGLVLANDGDGTDITGSLGTAGYTFVPPPPEPPQPPVISSPTHPDQNRWYPNNSPHLQWTTAGIPIGISYVLDQDSGTVPDTVSDGLINSQNYSELADGTWYFHARQQTDLGWSAAAHFRLQIDTTKQVVTTTVYLTSTVYLTTTTTLPCETTTVEISTTCLPVVEWVTTTVYLTTTCPVTIVEQTLTITKEIAAAPQVIIRQIQAAKENPQVQKTAIRVVAGSAAAVLAGLLPFVSWLDFLPFLRLLFLQPLLLLGLRRRAKWGKVYNSLNKQPVDLAIVRLFNAENNRLVQTKVTDLKGHYVFIVGPGRYRLEVKKDNFIFPSNFLAGMKDDGMMTDIYHGEIIEVTDINTAITATVPLDPVGVFKKPWRIFWERIGRRLQTVLSVLGIIATAVSLYISPKWYIAALLVLHIVLYILFRRFALPKVKGWGIVYDAATRKPVSGTIVRLFNSRLNKLVATQITDKRGRYNFIAGDDKYYLSFEHKNYLPSRSALIDLGGKASTSITVDVGLKKGVIGGDTDVRLSSS